MAFEIKEITSALSSLWSSRPPHLHRVELFSSTGMHSLSPSQPPQSLTHWRIDLDCNWEEPMTLEQRLAVFKGDTEMIGRFLREKSLTGKSNATIVGKHQYTETKHLYFDASTNAKEVMRRAARAVELLPDMARWQPDPAHHKAIDIDDFGETNTPSLHVSQLSHQKWESLFLLPAGYHGKPRERVARSSLPQVP